MSGRHQPENGADSAQALANAIANDGIPETEAGLSLLGAFGRALADRKDGAAREFMRRLPFHIADIERQARGIVPACIACELPADPGSVWCRQHRLRVEEEDRL